MAEINKAWWQSDRHKLSIINTQFCTCPYHEKLRADAEDDARDRAEADAENDKRQEDNNNFSKGELNEND